MGEGTQRVEVNFDGLVGPTHNYAGLAAGNLASQQHRNLVSNPQAAALQGLGKMRQLLELGIPQGVLPPHERPHLPALRSLGFSGTADSDVIAAAHAKAPELLRAASSAAAMWTANAATVTPSSDSNDGRVHFTPANLQASFHRALEAGQTTVVLRRIFAAAKFVVHDPLPASKGFGDEGAANHTRLAWKNGFLHLFVFGRGASGNRTPTVHPARQTLAASMAVARRHQIPSERVMFVQQHPAAIDAGVFHHDVIGVGHEAYKLVHEQAFLDADVLAQLRSACEGNVTIRQVTREELSLPDAVSTYLFNSQMVRDAAGNLVLIAPEEVRESDVAGTLVDKILAEEAGPARVAYFPLRESMQNGGGPACLRLRVPLSMEELALVHAPCLMTADKLDVLEAWVHRHYRDRLSPDDLADPQLLEESRSALQQLTDLLELGPIYPFQGARYSQ